MLIKLYFLAPKVYSLLSKNKNFSKIKGLSKEGVKTLKFEEFEKKKIFLLDEIDKIEIVNQDISPIKME